MTRDEALRILGLDSDATQGDIKAAYKETAQILHPDRFATNKKLQERATEQFKNLQSSYEYLTSTKGRSAAKSSASANRAKGYSPANELEARIAGIAAARTQLVAQRDLVADERRNGLIIGALGLGICALLRRIPVAIALGSAAVIWGLVQTTSAHNTIRNLDEHLSKLATERKRLLSELDEME